MQPPSSHVAAPPKAKWLWPSLALGLLGLLALVWSVSNVLEGTQRTIVGNFYTTELAGPGTYESELEPGNYQLVLFDLNQSDVTVSSGRAAVPLPFRDGVSLGLNQSQGGTSTGTTIEGRRVADLRVNDANTYLITLSGEGTVFTNSFDDAPGAQPTGGSPFASAGLGDAIGDNAVPLLAGVVAMILGLIGTVIAMRAKGRHKKKLAFDERTARNAARIAARKQG